MPEYATLAAVDLGSNSFSAGFTLACGKREPSLKLFANSAQGLL
jgi:hypothetical protein